MLLTIDVGNTQTHFGMFRGEELVDHFRFATSRTTTSDELAIRIAALLRLRGLTLDDIDGAIVASVVPQQDQEWIWLNERYFHGRLLFVAPGIKLGIEATAIATGGLAPAIAPCCEELDDVDDLLTLTGLRLVWERNRP